MKKRAKGKPKIKLSLRFFFEQIGGAGCGVCAVNTILKKNNLKGAIFLFSMTRGTSPKRMLHELRKAGLIAVSKTIKIAKSKTIKIAKLNRGPFFGIHVRETMEATIM